jgi:hypothetical protein
MVEKGDKGLDETPPSSFEEASQLERLRLAMLNVENSSEESDNDESEDEEDVTSQATVDTNVVTDYKAMRLALYDNTRCLVELALKVQSHYLYCGYPRQSCPRPKHRILEEMPGKIGATGVYQQLPNAKGTVFDAVVDTLTSVEALEEQWQANWASLEQLGASKVKQAAEEAAKNHSAPVVRIDTAPRGPRLTQMSGWTRDLPQTPSGDRTTTGGGGIKQIAPPTAVTPAPLTGKPQTKLSGTVKPSIKQAASTSTTTGSTPSIKTGSQPVTAKTSNTSGNSSASQTPAPAPATNPPPATGGAPGHSDPALIAILSTLVNRFDQMTAAQNQMAQTNLALLQQVSDQQAQTHFHQHQLESLRVNAKQPAILAISNVVPENVSIPSEASNRNKRFYAVARGRRPGVFT